MQEVSDKRVPHISETRHWSTGVLRVGGFSPPRPDESRLFSLPLSPKNKQFYFYRPIFPLLKSLVFLSLSLFLHSLLLSLSLLYTSPFSLNRSMHTPRSLSQSLFFFSHLKSDKYWYISQPCFSIFWSLKIGFYFGRVSLFMRFLGFWSFRTSFIVSWDRRKGFPWAEMAAHRSSFPLRLQQLLTGGRSISPSLKLESEPVSLKVLFFIGWSL